MFIAAAFWESERFKITKISYCQLSGEKKKSTQWITYIYMNSINLTSIILRKNSCKKHAIYYDENVT